MSELINHNCPVEGSMMIEVDKPCNWCDQFDKKPDKDRKEVMFYFSSNSLSHMQGVDPRLIEITTKALKISKIDFGIPADGGVRTAERQNELYLADASNADGYLKLSKHQPSKKDNLGKALDFYAYVDGHASWDEYYLTHIAAAHLQAASFLGHSLEWGGFWTNPIDMPHIQLAKARRISYETFHQVL